MSLSKGILNRIESLLGVGVDNNILAQRHKIAVMNILTESDECLERWRLLVSDLKNQLDLYKQFDYRHKEIIFSLKFIMDKQAKQIKELEEALAKHEPELEDLD